MPFGDSCATVRALVPDGAVGASPAAPLDDPADPAAGPGTATDPAAPAVADGASVSGASRRTLPATGAAAPPLPVLAGAAAVAAWVLRRLAGRAVAPRI